MNILWVLTGGGLGAVARYLAGVWLMSRFPEPPFPVAMLIVNLVGSLGLGFFFGLYFQAIPLEAYDDSLYLFLGLGFFGAFTTFSTFSTETVTFYTRRRKSRQLSMYFSL
ncbi:CrcB family protein [Thalassobacillus sp. C254]|uniref:fluoride efflux transporter FluC n=1 Tax=Thalassobacillus sp. C254 TaxID=1225341 RepID=UPI0022B600F4|nr:CrcB family protein [Thalassobacillus sp. C254]